jgi:putative acetyltransferase
MNVRKFEPADAPALAQLFYAAVHQLAALHYSAEQVHAWAPAVPASDRFIRWSEDGRLLLVAIDDDGHPLAFGDLEQNGHIDHLFCRPDMAGKGVTSMIYRELELAAKKQGMKLLYVEASEPARRFFLRNGFRVKHRRDFFLGNVAIHNYQMEKEL